MRVLTGVKLADEEKEFFELMSLYFPQVYDVKYLMKSCKNLKGGLQEVADALEVSRYSVPVSTCSHDNPSLLTCS